MADPLIVAQALNVLYEVTTLAVLALGLAVVFGLLGVLNIAHGEFIMVGAYCAYWVQARGWPFPLAIPAALAVGVVLGLAVEISLIRPLYRRSFDTLVATWGLSLLLRKSAEAVFGLGYYSVDMPLAGTVAVAGVDYPAYRLLLIVLGLALVAALALFFRLSRTGTRIKAMVGNPELAQAVGMPVRRLAAGTFVAGLRHDLPQQRGRKAIGGGEHLGRRGHDRLRRPTRVMRNPITFISAGGVSSGDRRRCLGRFGGGWPQR
jgi:branched-subunit amino acid ABC-type transport system permease component